MLSRDFKEAVRLFEAGVKDIYYSNLLKEEDWRELDRLGYDVIKVHGNTIHSFVCKNMGALIELNNSGVVHTLMMDRRDNDYHHKLGLLLGFPPEASRVFADKNHPDWEDINLKIDYCDGMAFRSFRSTVLKDIEFLLTNKKPISNKYFNIVISKDISRTNRHLVETRVCVDKPIPLDDILEMVKENLLN